MIRVRNNMEMSSAHNYNFLIMSTVRTIRNFLIVSSAQNRGGATLIIIRGMCAPPPAGVR